eukprot:NODE_8917_length_496_cov_3.035794_g7847_i0.p2 GENE.NODE_8917_length_496_cov_3.035794_g7847_i0~~NODE_8917_length_496_cov_3.035794_g7847_i0.p2  ORF type:complete len:62 (+),score=4.80 NODE_8917_length_496_cov_3.035794_g7847_i0:115-300(+)
MYEIHTCNRIALMEDPLSNCAELQQAANLRVVLAKMCDNIICSQVLMRSDVVLHKLAVTFQ